MRVVPDSPAVGLAYRLLMAASLPRIAARPDPASRALRRALWTTALGHIPRDERSWIGRIEARRAELVTGAAARDPSGSSAPDAPPSEGREDVSRTARWSTIPPVWGRFLMRMVRELAPKFCLELGTGFGISAAYQATALELNGTGTLTTFELDHVRGAIAEESLSRLGLDRRVELRLEPLGDSLAHMVQGAGAIDYAFLDADHSEEATVAHFETVLPHLAPGAVVVIDDINWSEGMRRAWKAIAGRERISTTVELRRVGIVVIAGSDDRAGLPE